MKDNCCWCLSSINKRICSQNIGIPLINESLKTKITKHSHMTCFQYFSKKFKQILFAFGEMFFRILATAFPIEYHTIWINRLKVDYKLSQYLILWLLFKSFEDKIYGMCLAWINQDLGAFHSFLFYTCKYFIIRSPIAECNNDCSNLFILFLWLK